MRADDVHPQDWTGLATGGGPSVSTTELLVQARALRSATLRRTAARLRRRLGAAVARLLHPTHAPAR